MALQPMCFNINHQRGKRKGALTLPFQVTNLGTPDLGETASMQQRPLWFRRLFTTARPNSKGVVALKVHLRTLGNILGMLIP